MKKPFIATVVLAIGLPSLALAAVAPDQAIGNFLDASSASAAFDGTSLNSTPAVVAPRKSGDSPRVPSSAHGISDGPIGRHAETAGAVTFRAVYSESANTFEIMDNVSNWWPGFCEPEYRKYWERRFGIGEEDKMLFAEYQALRRRYYNDPDQAETDPLKNRNGFFATAGAIHADPVAEAFYSSQDLDEAFARLPSIVSKSDADFLRKFYGLFRNRYAALLTESRPFKDVALAMDKTLGNPDYGSYFDEVARFYRVKKPVSYQITYVWWPPIARSEATATGDFLVMRYNPTTQLDAAKDDGDIVFHEIIHTISARQELPQKQTLTKEFLESCAVGGRIDTLKILEEPLAVVFGQMLFLERFDPAKFKSTTDWYKDPWINRYAKSLMPLAAEQLSENRTITDGFIPQAAELCRNPALSK